MSPSRTIVVAILLASEDATAGSVIRYADDAGLAIVHRAAIR
jgi:hypothetical protein